MSRIKPCVFLVLFLCQLLRSGSTARAQDHNVPGLPNAILAAKPAELLGCLPATPPGWTLTRSDGTNTFVSWLTTHVQRDIKQDPPPPMPGVPPPVPGKMWIRINDDGYSSDYSPGFAPPKTGNPPSNTTFSKFGEYPARRQKLDDITFSYCILVKRRFMIEVHAENVLDKDVQSYLLGVDYKRLLAIPDTGPNQVPQPVIVSRVDELNPAKSKTYPVFWSTDEQRGKPNN